MQHYQGLRTAFNFNGDFSGDVLIRTEAGQEIQVDGGDLLSFVAECYVRRHLISKTEQMSAAELLHTHLSSVLGKS